MAELAGLIIFLFVTAGVAVCYFAYRLARYAYTARKRWRTEIVAEYGKVRVKVTRPGTYHDVAIADLTANSPGFDEKLDEAIRNADLVAAQMNVAKEVSRGS